MKDIEYHISDSRWELWSAKTIEEHIEKNVIKGKFHDHVPKDIKSAYQTIEYIMAHAFYHYPMYDVAVKELTALMEMAVKIRANQKSISLTYKDKKGSEKPCSLNNLIDQVLKGKETEAEILKEELHKVRNLRNSLIHRDSNSFAGASFQNTIWPTINRINELFYERDIRTEDFFSLYDKMKQFKNKCLVLETQKQKYLILLAQLNDSLSNKNLYVFNYEILLNTVEEGQAPSESRIVILKSLTIGEELIEAVPLSGDRFKIYPSTKLENINKYKVAAKLIKQNPDLRATYHVKLLYLSREVEQFRYNNAWQ